MTKPVVKIPIIIDTREQTPWSFVDDQFTSTTGTLVTGDYSVAGLTDVIAIERKSIGDAVSSFIHDWNRERRKFLRLAGFDHPLLVIECSIQDILQHKYESDAKPESVLGKINAIMIDHGIPAIFAGDRETAETFVERFLIQCVRKCGGLPV
jgi:DNA excision repair protein ERCC-4